MCFLTFKWQIFVNNALRILFNFPLLFSDFLIKNAIDLENSFIFLTRNGLSSLKLNVFNSNIFFNKMNFF